MENFFLFVSEEWILVSILLVLIYLYAQREKSNAGQPLNIHAMTQLVNTDSAVLLDVRDSADYSAGHIVDAINIPHSKVAARMVELDNHKDKTIVVIDKMGQHASFVGKILKNNGYEVRRLAGGMSEWNAQGLPLVK